MTDVESQPKDVKGPMGPIMPTMPFPMIHLPGFTDFTLGQVGSTGNFCHGYEMDFHRCLARVGLDKHTELCYKESEDFVECRSHSKQLKRYRIMEAERKRQGKAPLPPPPYDSLGTNNPA